MSVKEYMNDVEKYSTISEEEEIKLAKMIETGSDAEREAAIEKLIVSNLRLVVKIANMFKRCCGAELDEMISYGNIGLINAAKKFRNGCGAKFSTHAAWWIKQSIKRHLDNRDVVRIPSAYNQKIKKVFKIASEFESRFGREPSVEEISEISKMKKEEVKMIFIRKHSMTYLDEEIGDEGSLHDILSINKEEKWTDGKEEIIKSVINIINSLPERDKYIIIKRFGLDGERPQKLEEVSEIIGKTKERVRQIQKEILNKIRVKIEIEDCL